MIAAAVIGATLVDATLGHRLVLGGRTVDLLVAHLGVRNAHSAAAVKLRFWIAFAQRRLCDRQKSRAYNISFYRLETHLTFTHIFLTLTTIQFVAAVCAVRLAGAHQVAGNARSVFALELVLAARHVRAVGRPFVVAVRTIYAAVAQPARMDARNAIVAQVFGGHARRDGAHRRVATLIKMAFFFSPYLLLNALFYTRYDSVYV